MPNANYIRGAQFERTVLNKLKDIGYDGIRSAGSHTAVDVVAWNKEYGDTYLIQCKHSIKKDIDFNSLFSEDNVVQLTTMPSKFIKVLCIKQPRSRTILQLVWNGISWTVGKVFKI